jgi:hypothetical protein
MALLEGQGETLFNNSIYLRPLWFQVDAVHDAQVMLYDEGSVHNLRHVHGTEGGGQLCLLYPLRALQASCDAV